MKTLLAVALVGITADAFVGLAIGEAIAQLFADVNTALELVK